MPLSNAILAIALGVSLAAPLARAETQPLDSVDPVLQALIDEALAHNPELLVSRQLELAAQARPAQAAARPGPTVGIFYQNDGVGPSLGREPMTMLGVSGGQDIPYPGKLGLRRQVAQAEAGVAGLDVERARLSLVGSVKRAYYGLLLARGLAALALEQHNVWQEVQEAARVRYASAVGSQQEMLRAQVEATRVQALHAQHHAEARARLAQLNALLGRPPDTAVDTTASLPLRPETRSAAEVVTWSEANSPELKAAALAIERDERAVELARLEFKPDFNVQGGLMYRGSLPPMWQASVSVALRTKTCFGQPPSGRATGSPGSSALPGSGYRGSRAARGEAPGTRRARTSRRRALAPTYRPTRRRPWSWRCRIPSAPPASWPASRRARRQRLFSAGPRAPACPHNRHRESINPAAISKDFK